jgi:hypothetical protein
VPGEHPDGNDAQPVDLIAHRGQRAHAGRLVHRDASALENAAAEPAQVLEEHGDQALVSGALPHQSVAGRAVGHHELGLTLELGPGLGRPPEEVGTPVQHADIHEPGQGEQLPLPAVGRDGHGEERRRVRAEPLERQDPSGGGELRRPDGVHLENVRVGGPGIEPLHIELVAKVGGIGGGTHLDPDARTLPVEPLELATQDLSFGAEHAAGNGHRGGAAGGRRSATDDAQEGQPWHRYPCCSAIHDGSSSEATLTNPGKARQRGGRSDPWHGPASGFATA